MQTAAPPLPSLTATPLVRGEKQLALGTRRRRTKLRRQMLGYVGISYTIDTIILAILANVGTIPMAIAPAYLACGLGTAAIFCAMRSRLAEDPWRLPCFCRRRRKIPLFRRRVDTSGVSLRHGDWQTGRLP